MAGEEDTEPVDEEFWGKCRTSKTDELEEEFLLRIYWKGIEGSNPKRLRRQAGFLEVGENLPFILTVQAWPYLLQLFQWNEDPEPKMTEFTEKYREDVERWRSLEGQVRRQDEEDFIAARHRKPSLPERESSIASDVFEEDFVVNGLVRFPFYG
ncbi:hypothetical protein NECAME_03491 [Necator americanus]|uniref:Uncharacterized protein n=1 Tax=Necator americanus TaxID=51031 RepID=W2T364_NECAM|nr:hypothetical protein NECAME_03491 [Necator americanus]ETN76328.1 hypothetical protein NECAME_03491 [Necator americanus]